MQPFGKPIAHHFGGNEKATEGFTLVQLIETSSIVAHFAENVGQAYIDIFSCKLFDNDCAVELCCRYFEPSDYNVRSLDRGIFNDEVK